MRPAFLPLLLVISVPASSCSSIFGTGECKTIGCSSGLEVVLEQPPEGPFRIEASASAHPEGPSYVYECAERDCPTRVFFPDFTPDRVLVRVITAGDDAEYEVVPEYAEARPNGEDCPPLCRTARIGVPSSRAGG